MGLLRLKANANPNPHQHPHPHPHHTCIQVSNDADVREAFGGMVWVLVPHTQSRILSIAATCLFVPLGKLAALQP